MDEIQEVSILLLGDAECGKSTFLSRISAGSSPSPSTPLKTLHDIDQPFLFDISFQRGKYRFEFYDTASPQNWQLLRPDVVVICYDISERLSLIHCSKYWRPQTTTHFTAQREIPVLLLGLKRDLRSETDPNGIIYPQEAHRIASELRCDRYMECSAKTGELVNEVFEDICKTAALTTVNGPEGNQGLSQVSACEIM